MPKLIYLNRGGRELENPTKRDIELLSRRDFFRRATVFLPLSFYLASTIRAKATSTIINRTISAASQNAIQMLNGTWGRAVTFPATWSKLRVACRCHFTGAGTTLTGNPIFAFGLNSGTVNQYGDLTTQNFIGIAFDTATWTNQASPQTFILPADTLFGRTRIGTTNASTTLYVDGAQPLLNNNAAANAADRQIIFADITKGSPNFTVHLPFSSASGPGQGADVSAANFLVYAGQTSPTPAEGGYYTTNLASPTFAFSEGTNGTLNAINFYWNRPDVAVEICDVAVALLA